ncbi:MAG: XRE family transcriptional regulator [Oscillospiraceae bacterium]|jgi:transcriptional regulator with XRE-family HTH domain|nr:XRE family transcriptional regulator [Oscillospiraceae bacterium]
MSRLGDLIQLERTRRGLTCKQVAKMCALSEKYVQDVELGKRIIADDQARRILKRIGLEQQTEADFSLDDIAATVDLHTIAPTLPQSAPAPAKPRPVASLPAEDSEHGGIWLDALAGVLREVPVYNAAWVVVDHRTLAAAGGKIEGGPADKALYFQAPDDSMRGFRIVQGDLLLTVPAQSPIDGAVMLLNHRGHYMIRKIQLSDQRLMLLSYDRELDARSVPLPELTFIGRCARLEAAL